MVAYLERLANEHGLRERLRLGVEVRGARFEDGRWRLDVDGRGLTADVLVAGCGERSGPHFPGLGGAYAGLSWPSARWDRSVPRAGRRVGVIGSGAIAIQIVPE